VTIGSFDKSQVWGNIEEPRWSKATFGQPYASGVQQGWTFNVTALVVGSFKVNSYSTETEVPLLIVSEGSRGYGLTTAHHGAGEWFVGNMTVLYDAVCFKQDLPGSTDRHYYWCTFPNKECSDVRKVIGDHLFLNTTNDMNHMGIEDVLVQNGSHCALDVTITRDPLAPQDFMTVGVATMARSQYLVYDYSDIGNVRIGLGGIYSSDVDPPIPDSNPLPIWAIALLVGLGLALIGIGAFFFRRHRQQKLKYQL
jgi:hypothetical protein